MFNWSALYNKSKADGPTLKDKQPAKAEDLTYTRTIQEKMASLEVGQTFALATRTGHHIFKKTSIVPYKNEDAT